MTDKVEWIGLRRLRALTDGLRANERESMRLVWGLLAMELHPRSLVAFSIARAHGWLDPMDEFERGAHAAFLLNRLAKHVRCTRADFEAANRLSGEVSPFAADEGHPDVQAAVARHHAEIRGEVAEDRDWFDYVVRRLKLDARPDWAAMRDLIERVCDAFDLDSTRDCAALLLGVIGTHRLAGEIDDEVEG